MLRHCAGGSGNLVALWNSPFSVVGLATAGALWVKRAFGKTASTANFCETLWGIHRYPSWRERQEELGLLDPSCGQMYRADVPFGPESVPNMTAWRSRQEQLEIWLSPLFGIRPLSHWPVNWQPHGPVWNGLVVELSRRPLLRSDSRPKIDRAPGNWMTFEKHAIYPDPRSQTIFSTHL